MTGPSPRFSIVICMILFLIQPIHFGLWLSRIGEVQASMGISKGDLSIALLGMPCGLLPSLYFAGRAVEAMGPKRALFWSFPPMLLTGVLPGMADGTATLFFALFLLGIVFAFAEVGLNVLAARVEKVFAITIMNRAHGFWSLGIVVGSLFGVLLGNLGFAAEQALQIAAITLLPLLVLTAAKMPELEQPRLEDEAPPVNAPIPAGIIAIVVVVFGATITEGAMNDWATVYMREAFSGGLNTDGYAVTVFAGMVTFGRFIGDSLNKRFGAVWLARVCLGSAIVGAMTLVLSPAAWVSFVGFGLVGFGVSTIFPLGISASAALSERGEARNVSIMTFGALSGFLIGPPMIGYISELSSLNHAFGFLIPLLIVSLLFSGRLVPKD